jgi:hypothetical protein
VLFLGVSLPSERVLRSQTTCKAIPRATKCAVRLRFENGVVDDLEQLGTTRRAESL